jgi:diaminohydroxyphosphoribosylaminopyrimidine deaminase/5-amino-6-(5-phosphoribosylamino)uracil reductase
LTEKHEHYMHRAIDLARRAPRTSPNPRVGAVVVRDGLVLGEGWHRGSGRPHAEREALAGIDARGATLYVTLEPCVHHGRTPPCVEAVVGAGVTRVVVAMEDPDERMRGAGLEYLRTMGVEVTTGILEAAAADLNAAFVHQRRTGRPLLTLKLAMSIDGRIAAGDGNSRWITGAAARRRGHQRRAEVDAVVVGAGTVLADDPRLTARGVPLDGQPTRVVVDARGRIPASSVLFDEGDAIVATTSESSHESQTSWKERGAEVVILPGGPSGVDLRAMLDDFAQRGWTEVLCEGGAALATSLLRAELPDRLEIYTGPALIGRPGLGIGDLGVASLAAARRLRVVAVERLGEDVLTVYGRGDG